MVILSILESTLSINRDHTEIVMKASNALQNGPFDPKECVLLTHNPFGMVPPSQFVAFCENGFCRKLSIS